MQTKEYAAVEVFRTPKKGCGLRTLMDLPKYALHPRPCCPAAVPCPPPPPRPRPRPRPNQRPNPFGLLTLGAHW